MKRIIRRMGQLSIVALLVGSAGVASATSVGMGSTVANFNILGNTGVTLTGVDTSHKLYVPVVGVSPNTSLTLTRAVVGTQHLNDTTAVTGQVEANALDASLTALTAGGDVTVTALVGGTLPGTLNATAGVEVVPLVVEGC